MWCMEMTYSHSPREQGGAEQNTVLNVLVICSGNLHPSPTWMLTPACIQAFPLAFLKTRKWIRNSHTAVKCLYVPSSCRYMSCHWQFQFKERTLKMQPVLTDVSQKRGNYTHPSLRKLSLEQGLFFSKQRWQRQFRKH